MMGLITAPFRYLWKRKRPIFCNTVMRPWITLFGKHDTRQMKYKVSLCLIFMNEAPFLKEWIDYHRVIGVDHFYLYNNDSTDGFREVLAPYVDEGVVTLIDFPGRVVQISVNKDCYERFRGETNWLGFLDADEFICLRYKTNIAEWLEGFDKYPAVEIKWLMFGTSGLVSHDFTRGVIEQYTSCAEELSDCGKSFLNTRFEIAGFDDVVQHNVRTLYRALGRKVWMLPIGQFGKFTLPFKLPEKRTHYLKVAEIWINHYHTKAFEELFKGGKTRDALYHVSSPKRRNKAYVLKQEEICVSKDYTIQRFLLRLKLAQGVLTGPFIDESSPAPSES